MSAAIPSRCLYCAQEDQKHILSCSRGWLCHVCGQGWTFEEQEIQDREEADVKPMIVPKLTSIEWRFPISGSVATLSIVGEDIRAEDMDQCQELFEFFKVQLERRELKMTDPKNHE